jgi:hypothetical protein
VKNLNSIITGYTMTIALLIEILASTATITCLIVALYSLYKAEILYAFANLIFGCVFGYINYKMGGN